MRKSRRLRKLLEGKDVIRIVGAHDGLSAKLVENNGFDGVWASGFEISTSFGVPDASILTMTQFLERACEINDSVNIPVIADCDVGYGNVNNVIHMINKYEAAGIAAVCIEDKSFPKINSFIHGAQKLAPISEFVGKILAAKNAQEDYDFMLIARVEALVAGLGMDEALTRANAYIKAGADSILIHSKLNDPSEIITFCNEWNKRSPIIVVPTTYPMLHIDEMTELGIKIVIYANQGIRAAIKATNCVLQEIERSGSLLSSNDLIAPMEYVFNLQGMSNIKRAEKMYLRSENENCKVIIPAAGDPSYEESMRDILTDLPIPMLDINGKSILERNIESLNRIGLFDITVITGYNSHAINVDGVSYIHNADFRSTTETDSIMLALENVNDSAIVIFSDILFDKSIIERIINSPFDITLLIDSSLPKKQSSIDYVVTKDPPINNLRRLSQFHENMILNIGKDLDKRDANFEFAGVSYFSRKGLRIFKDAYHTFEKTRKKELKPRQHLLQIIQHIIDNGVHVCGLETTNGWIEIRNFENYKTAYGFFDS